jgi:hypothetical protein
LNFRSIRGPSQLTVELAPSRLFPIREAIRLEVRGEVFNVINHVNYGVAAASVGVATIADTGINLNLSSPTLGRITTAGDPRILQIGVKLYF